MWLSFVCTSHLYHLYFIPAERQARHCHAGAAQSFSLFIHSRIYGAQFSSFTPSASQPAKKCSASRSITPTFFRSKTMPRWSVWSSKSLLISAIACFSFRPLRTNTVNLPRAAVSILKVIGHAVRPPCRSRLCCTASLPSEHPSRAVQPSTQLDLTENRARNRKLE